MHPLNLALRFALEVVALAALAGWGWSSTESGWRWVAAVGSVLLAALVWAAFAVPGDPSRGGQGWVHVPGALRLLIELVFFGVAAFALSQLGRPRLALGFAVVVLAHYAWSHERIAWLLKQ